MPFIVMVGLQLLVKTPRNESFGPVISHGEPSPLYSFFLSTLADCSVLI